ncbi:omega/kappa-hexatoxin-Ar1g-like [Anneissia japonica]|uniref:omega/kappa-hexatoxin-Ar1g-like n=1 Tax=Anneissia japonica TaxID=1529436 RepID=UPI0014257E8B|nr:omega/kappa-hexatoxin-Ar1g-like [Anneissia japonica]
MRSPMSISVWLPVLLCLTIVLAEASPKHSKRRGLWTAEDLFEPRVKKSYCIPVYNPCGWNGRPCCTGYTCKEATLKWRFSRRYKCL